MTGKRKFESGSSKRKKKERQDKLTESLMGSMNRYVKSTNILPNLAESATIDENLVENVCVNDANLNSVNVDEAFVGNMCVNNANSNSANVDEALVENLNHDEDSIDIVQNVVIDDEPLNVNLDVNEEDLNDLFDPGNWEKNMPQRKIDFLVEKGPIRVSHEVYPVNGQNRSFSNKCYTRPLRNGEKLDRPWLVYSRKNDKVFCFCCVLFKRENVMSSPLTTATIGYNDWKNIYSRLNEHEKSNDHLNCLTDWMEAETRLRKKMTIDSSNEKVIEKEKMFWGEVLKRIMCVVKTLASNNSAFRGSNEKLDDPNNGIFLSIIRMIADFDPIMEEHLRRIRKKEIRRFHYLGHNIQNELILLLASEIKRKILITVKEAKYFSVILDCTPDVSHEEQMSLILRCVNVSTNPITVEEFFIGFLKVVETTEDSLFLELKDALAILNLDLNDIRGQGYDNGSNMKGHYKGVSSRVLKEYPRAFYSPCSCHSLNLVLCDMAMSSVQAKSFFGVIQRIYKLFSGSTKRWEVLKTYVKDRNGKGLTLKLWSDTRWESRVASVKAIRFQAPQIRDALYHLVEHSVDATTTSDASSLANYELQSFDFLVGMVIWFEILQKVNKVSKILQSKDMNIEECINLLQGLILFLEEYIDNGFAIAKSEAKKIAVEMGVEPTFRETRVRLKKRFFDENARDEPIQVAEESFRVNYFITVIDIALSSLKTRFEQFKKYEDMFGYLFNLSKLKAIDDETMKCACTTLEDFLKHGDYSDIDGLELFSELQLLRKSLPDRIIRPIEVLEYIKNTCFAFPNTWIAYRILLTIPVTVASAERSFSKLKLIKNYLRSTMSQERLNGLAMLSIEKKISAELDYSDLIREFAHKKARRVITS
ncbi:hypothetical protein OROGR_030418 [Orobanche gracilis]